MTNAPKAPQTQEELAELLINGTGKNRATLSTVTEGQQTDDAAARAFFGLAQVEDDDENDGDNRPRIA